MAAKMQTYIVLFLITFFCSLSASGTEFSADSDIITKNRTFKSRFYFADDRWRIEESTPDGKRITIFRKDKKSLYVLWPDKKRYIEQKLPKEQLQVLASRKPGEEVERKELGQEEISGRLTTKYRVTYAVQGRRMLTTEWFSKDLDVILRSESEDGSWTTVISNIEEGKQDSSLFEIPSDYQRLSAEDVLEQTR